MRCDENAPLVTKVACDRWSNSEMSIWVVGKRGAVVWVVDKEKGVSRQQRIVGLNSLGGWEKENKKEADGDDEEAIPACCNAVRCDATRWWAVPCLVSVRSKDHLWSPFACGSCAK